MESIQVMTRKDGHKEQRYDPSDKKQVRAVKKMIKVLHHYGGEIPRCRKCGICDVRFLVLDHIEGNGTQDRYQHGCGSTFYNWIIRVNFPPKFQILCYYCNLKKNRRSDYD